MKILNPENGVVELVFDDPEDVYDPHRSVESLRQEYQASADRARIRRHLEREVAEKERVQRAVDKYIRERKQRDERKRAREAMKDGEMAEDGHGKGA